VLKALLFDMDGTLTDTDHIHMTAWQEVLARHDVVIDKAIYDSRITGRTNPLIVNDFLPHLDDQAVHQVVNEKETAALRMMQTLEPVAGLHEVLHWQTQQNLKLALVTNATHATVPFVLDALGLSETFKVRILAEDVIAGKPDPIHYQVALERLGVKPENAIAFEDSPSGVRSAAGAGIKVVALTTSQPPQVLKNAGASLVIADFTAPELWKLLRSYE
jgi:HAD superfamily hydrolase (TIGR01509 family)